MAHESGTSAPGSPSPVNFIFVDQAEDLVAVSHKRILNQRQRQVIRSHVMQRVRQEELAQGKTRSAARDQRDSSRRSSKSKSRKGSSDSDRSPPNDSSAVLPDSIKKEPTEYKVNPLMLTPRNDENPTTRLVLRPLPFNKSLAVHEFDPFDTLPTNGLPHISSENLLSYCELLCPLHMLYLVLTGLAGFDVMLPLTFSLETKRAQDRLARQGMVLQSKISNPATFLGFMATVAAHRAVLYGRHKDLAPSDANHDDLITDPEYIRVKHEAMVAVRKSFANRETLEQDMVEASFSLITTATVVGNFEEAKMHLLSISRLVRQVDNLEGSMMWLPISNVKVSVGLLSHPLLPLLFTREIIPQEIKQRISPGPGSDLNRLGSDFIPLEVSDQLKFLLSGESDLCHFCELSAGESHGLSSEENLILRKKATELEFDLLAYPYENPAFPPDECNEPQMPALEAIIRVAALGLLQISPHTIIPATGLGRALTRHEIRVTDRWLRERRRCCGVSELKAICWALFIFTQNSLGQVEEAFFTRVLAELIRELWLLTWPDVQVTMRGFLYIPRLQSSIWENIWTESQKIDHRSSFLSLGSFKQ